MNLQLQKLRRLETTMTALSAKAAMLPSEQVSLDPVAWAEEITGYELDPWQKEVMRSDHKRHLLLCSRQTGKTETVALKAAFTAKMQPGCKILTLAPSHRQSRNLFSRISHTLAADPSVKLERMTQTECDLAGNGSSIVALPGNDPDRIRGMVADVILIDEGAFVLDSVLQIVFPMISTTNGSITMLSTPSGPQGVFHSEWEDGQGWNKTIALASDCPRISPEFLEEARIRLGDMAYRQEYLCEFLQSGAAFFSADLIADAFADPEHLSLIEEAFN